MSNSINNYLSNKARKIAEQLDILDGKDGKIQADTWKKYAVTNWHGKDNITNYINIFKAYASIKECIEKERNISGETYECIGEKWYGDIVQISNSTQQPDKENNNIKTDVGVAISQNYVEEPVSTNVVKPIINDEILVKNTDTLKDRILNNSSDDIDQFVKLTKMTISSSAKAANKNKNINKDILNAAFDNVIHELMKKGGKNKSVLIGAASDFINAADMYDVDVFVLMGVSMIESAYGTSKMALSKNNVGGLTPNGTDGIYCQTVSDSINIVAKTLNKNIYSKGLDTIKSVGMKGNYCCAASSVRAQWTKNVTFFANKVRDEYNRLLELAQQA